MKLNLRKEFIKLKNLLKKYEGTFIPKVDSDTEYDLWSFKDVEILGRKKSEINFAVIQVKSSYIGFYFMPIYIEPAISEKIENNLLKLLKGKSCFHIKSIDQLLIKQITHALKVGYDYYLEKKFV